MMYTVENYVVRVHKKKNKGSEKIISNDLNLDLPKIVRECIGQYYGRHGKFEIKSQAFTAGNLKSDGHYYQGRIYVGEYGTITNIVNIINGENNYTKTKNDADLYPYDFVFFLKGDNDYGVMSILKKSGGGPLSIIQTILKDSFKKIHEESGLELKINPLTSKSAIQHLQKGEVKEIRFINHKLNSDLADKVNGDKSSQEGKFEVVVKPKRGFRHIVDKFVNYLEGDDSKGDIYEIINMKFDEIKTKIEINGRERTISISRSNLIKASIDITDDIKFSDDGVQDHVETVTLIKSIIVDLSQTLGGTE